MRQHIWYLVADKSGHHRAVAEGHRLKSGEVVLGPPYTYERKLDALLGIEDK